MKTYYECHITFVPDNSNPYRDPILTHFTLKNAVEECGWLYSQIDGDPDFGPGDRMYATKQYNSRRTMFTIKKEMDAASKTIAAAGAIIQRNKVEKVIYDRRFK